MKKLYSITVKGKQKEWGFDVWLDPKYLPDWREDGLQIDEVFNIIPVWVL